MSIPATDPTTDYNPYGTDPTDPTTAGTDDPTTAGTDPTTAGTDDPTPTDDTSGADGSTFDSDIRHIMGSSAPPPTPTLPPSGVPTLPDDLPNGALDYLSKLLDYIHDHPSDITALYSLVLFITKMTALSPDGKLPSDVDNLLQSAGGLNGVASAVMEAAQYAFFAGYNGKTGRAAIGAYIDDMMKLLSGKENDYITKMYDTLYTFSTPQGNNQSALEKFINEHSNAAGDRIWVIRDKDGKIIYTYNWSNADQTDKYNDQYFITEIIAGNEGNDDQFRTDLKSQIEKIQRDYRMLSFDKLLEQYKNDPMLAVTMFMMGAFDDHLQSQQSGLNDTTDALTMMTNEIATRLSTLAKKVGYTKNADGTYTPNMSAQDVQDFIAALAKGTTLMDVKAQLSGIKSDWDKNVYQAICGIAIADPQDPTKQTTLGAVLFDTTGKYTPADKQKALCGLNKAPGQDGSTPDNQAPPNAGYQALVSVIEQAGSYITGTSKTVSMQLQTSTDTAAQLIKTWGTMLQDIEQQIIKMISNYKTG